VETFDFWIRRYHRCLSIKQKENVRSFGQRVHEEARKAHAAQFAYGQQIEDYGYAVNEHGTLLILTEPYISRRIYNVVYREFHADPRYAQLFPVQLTTEQPDAIRAVSAESIELFASACESRMLDATPAPRQQPKQNSPRGQGPSGGGSVNQVPRSPAPKTSSSSEDGNGSEARGAARTEAAAGAPRPTCERASSSWER